MKKSGGSTEKSAGEREISKIDLDKLEKSKLEKERRKSAQHVPSGSTGLVKKRISDANASFVASSPMLALTSNLNSSGRMQVSSSSFIAPTVLAGFSPSSHQKADALRETMKQSRTGRDWKSPSKRVYGKVISREVRVRVGSEGGTEGIKVLKAQGASGEVERVARRMRRMRRFKEGKRSQGLGSCFGFICVLSIFFQY